MTFSDYVLLVAVGGGLLLPVILFMARRRGGSRRGVRVVDWENRAQVAERRAVRAEASLKAGLIPHLARLLRARLVTGLLFQRRELVESHRQGAERAEALEERLASAHEDLQEKLRGYESKLQELQKKPDVAADRKASPAGRGTRETAPPRRNPLVQRPVRPAPDPVRFAELLSRKRQGNGREGRPATEDREDGEPPKTGREWRP